jgi:hypothetical protein
MRALLPASFGARLPRRLLALGLLVAVPSVAGSVSERGRALFVGREALSGKLRHHRSPLPAEVVACRNCHALGPDAAPRAARGPRLDRALLLEQRPRRGGPPSAYAEASFCKLLRTGIDPAHVMIAREMPVYRADDAQCLSLWQFLTEDTQP